MTTALARTVLDRFVAAFEPHRDPVRAAKMSEYMRGLFPFLGIMKTERVALMREATAELGPPTERDAAAVAAGCWKRDEREYQYAGVWYVRRSAKVLGPGFLADAERLITTRSWWDTVDDLAVNVAGDLVRRHAALTREMDDWIGSDDIWLARTAILHQLKYRAATDRDRLFSYCLRRAGDTEFFIRKAIGWALREYSKTDAAAVSRFVDEHAGKLSGLSKREALKWLDASRREASSDI